MAPIILWFRRDLRLSDHEALTAASKTGRPIIPVFIKDAIFDDLRAATKWRFGLGIENFAETLGKIGSNLILKSGDAEQILLDLVEETGADTVIWSRAYDPDSIERDTQVKKSLSERGAQAESFRGHLLFEPWWPKTKSGEHFKVYSPFWRNVSQEFDVDAPLPKIEKLNSPSDWPKSEQIDDWKLGHAMGRSADVVIQHVYVGENAALSRLDTFIDKKIGGYKSERDFPSRDATSGLSENLTYGEISPRQMFHAARLAAQTGAQGAEHFQKEIVWREFAYHLLWNFPELDQKEWRGEWANFPWKNEDALAWKQGRTGEPFVDAAMRELYVTGTMHNRLRMVVGSYLTKNMLVDWRVGLDWFQDCLIDWDPASNAMGWQWIAGCGPDAAPYFRIFNPATQAEKFDGDKSYRNRFLDAQKSNDAAQFFDACPKSWKLSKDSGTPRDILSLSESRKNALLAYEKFRENKS